MKGNDEYRERDSENMMNQSESVTSSSVHSSHHGHAPCSSTTTNVSTSGSSNKSHRSRVPSMKGGLSFLFKSETTLNIPTTSDLNLEAKLCLPFPSQRQKKICAIVAHPYGPLGGNMENNVVLALCVYLAHLGIATIRFNFRGVGKSQGRTSFTASGEIEDVISIAKYAQSEPDLCPDGILLCGYSYGSIATCAALRDISNVVGLISISYPSGVMWALTLGNSKKYVEALKEGCTKTFEKRLQKIFISGDADNFTSKTSFKAFASSLPDPICVATIRDMDHFWLGAEHVLIRYIHAWIRKYLPWILEIKIIPSSNCVDEAHQMHVSESEVESTSEKDFHEENQDGHTTIDDTDIVSIDSKSKTSFSFSQDTVSLLTTSTSHFGHSSNFESETLSLLEEIASSRSHVTSAVTSEGDVFAPEPNKSSTDKLPAGTVANEPGVKSPGGRPRPLSIITGILGRTLSLSRKNSPAGDSSIEDLQVQSAMPRLEDTPRTFEDDTKMESERFGGMSEIDEATGAYLDTETSTIHALKQSTKDDDSLVGRPLGMRSSLNLLSSSSLVSSSMTSLSRIKTTRVSLNRSMSSLSISNSVKNIHAKYRHLRGARPHADANSPTVEVPNHRSWVSMDEIRSPTSSSSSVSSSTILSPMACIEEGEEDSFGWPYTPTNKRHVKQCIKDIPF